MLLVPKHPLYIYLYICMLAFSLEMQGGLSISLLLKLFVLIKPKGVFAVYIK